MISVEAILATWRRQLTEDSARSIITGETGFAHTRTVVKSAHGPLIPVVHDASFDCRMMGTRLAAHCNVVCRGPGSGYWNSLPIVDDEGCDFFYSTQIKLACVLNAIHGRSSTLECDAPMMVRSGLAQLTIHSCGVIRCGECVGASFGRAC